MIKFKVTLRSPKTLTILKEQVILAKNPKQAVLKTNLFLSPYLKVNKSQPKGLVTSFIYEGHTSPLAYADVVPLLSFGGKSEPIERTLSFPRVIWGIVIGALVLLGIWRA